MPTTHLYVITTRSGNRGFGSLSGRGRPSGNVSGRHQTENGEDRAYLVDPGLLRGPVRPLLRNVHLVILGVVRLTVSLRVLARKVNAGDEHQEGSSSPARRKNRPGNVVPVAGSKRQRRRVGRYMEVRAYLGW